MNRVAQLLRDAGIHNARREAAWLLEAAGDPDGAVELARRRIEGEPLQYLTGLAGFRHLDLEVGPGCFVPRPETELVAERAMELLAPNGTLVDVGTGSGAIAFAVATERPDATVIATEVSEEALVWARRNRERCGADVALVHGDLLDDLDEDLRGRVDVVVSNPPYVPPEEGRLLPINVRDHEPAVALFAPDHGLAVIRRLADSSRQWLRAGGWLVLEIGETQDDAVATKLRDAGYADVQTRRDLTGRTRIAEGRVD